ncbi:NCS2 family nucleobase:cation symporter-2 [Endobacter medicaginis]|uniref:NCS2 family nucleobase:cation symporter-2 n=1 Tax=Endobacter medicaginis TaxID=1181271 RepID=A0A850NIM0_9PROT|nr:solute carrier family 23 protein [Endobacter medicaginis]MBB3173922.1 NCS2 family nucleobase:cation symporter-2 [Endobacter medicaginis]MCX5475957.1 purine/pyrimidine permease [Endobacter medicaginis]NVN29483.1 purine/pyrimidine permease [Endobacter medicaginis]
MASASLIADTAPRTDVPPRAAILIPQAIQHALVMYAGVVTVPLLIGRGLGLTPEQIVQLVDVSLLTSGIATLIQSLGLGNVGARLPLVQGTSFGCAMPLLQIAKVTDIPTMFGAALGAGLVAWLLAPLLGRMMRLLPEVANGCVIVAIGLMLVPIAGNWLGGGAQLDAAHFAAPGAIALGLATAVITMLLYVGARRSFASVAILAGMIIGCVLAILTGQQDIRHVVQAPLFDLPPLLPFGRPQFHLVPILIMSFAMSVLLSETMGNCVAVARLMDVPLTETLLARAFRADGLATALGVMFGGFPYNAFTQNTALVAMSSVRSRFIVAGAGAVLVVLGFCPRLGAWVATIPACVLGGAALVMFGTIMVAGLREIAHHDLSSRRNATLTAAGLIAAALPTACPRLFANLAPQARIFLDNGLVLCALVLITLHLILPRDAARGD